MSGPPRSIVLLVLGVALLAGCSTFERDWDALGAGAAAPDDAGVEGRWSGIWASRANDHSGGLRCILHQDETGTLHARYRATYARILTFEYTVPMTVRSEGEAHHFAGEADLGWLAGGHYEYRGTVVGDEFESTYRCERDHGVFRMRRVGADPPPAAAD